MYPLKSDFQKGDPITEIGAEWLNTVANILNNLSIQGGTIEKDVYGLHWVIIPAFMSGAEVTVLDDVSISAGTVSFSRKKLLVLGAEDTDDADQTFTETELHFLKVTTLDVDGCPDSSEWRTIKFITTSDVASTIDD